MPKYVPTPEYADFRAPYRVQAQTATGGQIESYPMPYDQVQAEFSDWLEMYPVPLIVVVLDHNGKEVHRRLADGTETRDPGCLDLAGCAILKAGLTEEALVAVGLDAVQPTPPLASVSPTAAPHAPSQPDPGAQDLDLKRDRLEAVQADRRVAEESFRYAFMALQDAAHTLVSQGVVEELAAHEFRVFLMGWAGATYAMRDNAIRGEIQAVERRAKMNATTDAIRTVARVGISG